MGQVNAASPCPPPLLPLAPTLTLSPSLSLSLFLSMALSLSLALACMREANSASSSTPVRGIQEGIRGTQEGIRE